MMGEEKFSSDAHQWMYKRYIKDDPEALAFLEKVKVQADLAGQIYSIRNKLHMTREDLAEFSGLTTATIEDIEDIEESDYDGDWNEATDRINHAFHHWFTNVLVPAAQMKPDEYSIKAVSA
ncbi:MAG: helix-turn-helix transcriptional regulator [Desulfomonilaceae bacterium]